MAESLILLISCWAYCWLDRRVEAMRNKRRRNREAFVAFQKQLADDWNNAK
jgi:hypothetical protein